MPTASSLAWKTSLRKVRTLWHYGRLGSVALYLWLIVVISVRQSTVAAISGLLPGAGYGQFEHKADSLIAKFKEAGGTVREIDVWAESPRLSPNLVICIIVCLSWAVNHCRDNAITYKAQRDKMPENWSWRTRQLLTLPLHQRDVAALDAMPKELADAKAENDALRDDVAMVVVGCTSKQSVSQCVKPPPPPAWIIQPPPTGRHRWTGLFSPSRERLITMQKQLEGQKYINEQCR